MKTAGLEFKAPSAVYAIRDADRIQFRFNIFDRVKNGDPCLPGFDGGVIAQPLSGNIDHGLRVDAYPVFDHAVLRQLVAVNAGPVSALRPHIMLDADLVPYEMDGDPVFKSGPFEFERQFPYR
jgi:hypothetical protein